MRTRLVALADVSSSVWMPGKAKESNALIGSMWPDVGRRWLPTLALRRIRSAPLLLAEWASAPGEYGLLEMGHPGGLAVQRQLAELMDDGGGHGVYLAAQRRQAKDGRGRFRDARELGRVVEIGPGITWIRATTDDCRTRVPAGPPQTTTGVRRRPDPSGVVIEPVAQDIARPGHHARFLARLPQCHVPGGLAGFAASAGQRPLSGVVPQAGCSPGDQEAGYVLLHRTHAPKARPHPGRVVLCRCAGMGPGWRRRQPCPLLSLPP